MLRIDDRDGLTDFNLCDLMNEFQDDVLRMDDEDIDQTELDLLTSQYAYVKFGLILQEVRIQSWWRKCAEGYKDLKSFCSDKLKLNIWQFSNAIKSARVAVQLAYLGFTDLPRNASQALKLSELSLDRLGEVWGHLVATCPGHKITALAIEQQINPDKQAISSTIKLPTALLERLRREAIERGISLAQYLEQLADDQQQADDRVEPVAMSIEVEVADIVDRPVGPIAAKKFLEQSLDRFDDLMHDLVGQFIPPHGINNDGVWDKIPF